MFREGEFPSISDDFGDDYLIEELKNRNFGATAHERSL